MCCECPSKGTKASRGRGALGLPLPLPLLLVLLAPEHFRELAVRGPLLGAEPCLLCLLLALHLCEGGSKLPAGCGDLCSWRSPSPHPGDLLQHGGAVEVSG